VKRIVPQSKSSGLGKNVYYTIRKLWAMIEDKILCKFK